MQDILERCRLFDGIVSEARAGMLGCLGAEQKDYAKGSFLLREGEAADRMGVLVKGTADILQQDYWGNRSILARIQPGELYGEAFACAQLGSLPLSAIALEDCAVLELKGERILRPCAAPCSRHGRLLANMLTILAEKNIALTRKMEHLSRRSTREKLLSYLSQQAFAQKAGEVVIPFNRQELADFLCVERSALSRELSAMAKAGILDYKKNRFVLHR